VKTRAEAADIGKAALQKMKWGRWSVRVWENLGWHVSLYSKDGYIRIHYSERTRDWDTYVSDEPDQCGDSYGGTWQPHKNPQKSLELRLLALADIEDHRVAVMRRIFKAAEQTYNPR
jgi:hypothetical protein